MSDFVRAFVLTVGAVLLSGLFMASTAVAQSQDVVPVETDDQTVQPGESFTVPVRVSNLNNSSDINSYQFDVDFSAPSVTLDDVITSGTLTEDVGWRATDDIRSGDATIASFGQTPLNNAGDSGVLVELEFTAATQQTVDGVVDLLNFDFSDPVTADLANADFDVTIAQNQVRLSDETTKLEAQTDTIDVTVSDVSGLDITSFDLEIGFNSNVVSPVANPVYKQGGLAENFQFAHNVSQGVLNISASATDVNESLSGSGTLFQIVVNPGPNAGTSNLTFQTATFSDSGGDPENIGPVDGSIEVVANQAPTAADDAASTNEDSGFTETAPGVLGNDSDPADDGPGDELSVSAVEGNSANVGTQITLASGALVTLDGNGSYSYDPNGQFENLSDGQSATDAFTYTVADGFGGTDQATVTVTINGVDDESISDIADQTIDEDTRLADLSFTVDDGDADTDPSDLTVTASSGNQNLLPDGNLSIEQGTATGERLLTAVPRSDSNGTATITLEVQGEVGATETFDLTVTPVNDPPVAVDDQYDMLEDDTLRKSAPEGLLANDRHPDGESFQASEALVEQPGNGSVTLSADGSFEYIPNPDFAGTDDFVYEVSDGDSIDTATVTVDVEQVNDRPTITEIADMTIQEDGSTGPVGFTVGDVETDSSALSVTATSGNPNLVPTDSIKFPKKDGGERYVVVTPTADSFGTAEIELTVTDQSVDGKPALDSSETFTLTVQAVNDPPVAVNDTFQVQENGSLSVTAMNGVLSNDSDVEGDPLTASLVSNVSNGSLTLNSDGSFDYEPDDFFSGEDSFTYEAADGKGGTDEATVTLEISSVNNAPVAVNDTFQVPEDTELEVPADSGASAFSATLDANQAGGNVGFGAGASSGGGTAHFVMTEDSNGNAVLHYEITLSGLDFSTFASGFNSTEASGDDVIGLHVHNAARGASGTISFGVLGDPSAGSTLDPTTSDDADRQVTVDNANNRVRISGTWEASEAGDPTNVMAAVGSDTDFYLNLHTEQNKAGEIRGQLVGSPSVSGLLANDSDPDGDPITVNTTTVNNPSNGSVVLAADGSFQYVPDHNFNGEDSFSYEISDPDGATDQATATINVEPVNDPPAITSIPTDTSTAFVNETLSAQIDANGGESGDDVTFSLVDDPPANSSIDQNGQFTFEPEPEQRDSTYTITVRAEDSGGLAVEGSFAVSVEFDVLLGDITDDGTVSAFDANRTLLASLGEEPPRPLSIRDSIAADVTKNGAISAGDASAILRFVVGAIDSFSEVQDGGSSSAKALTASARSGAELTWGEVRSTSDGSVLPIRVEGNVGDVYGLEFTVSGNLGAVNTENVQDALPESWMMVSRVDDASGDLKIAMAGPEPLREPGDVVRLPVAKTGPGVSLQASGVIGEGQEASLGQAPVTAEVPGSFQLLGNYPNPVANQTTISFNLPSSAKVKVEVYDMLGRRVATVPAQEMQAGEERTVQLDASGLSSGVYLYRVSADAESTDWTESGRMVISN